MLDKIGAVEARVENAREGGVEKAGADRECPACQSHAVRRSQMRGFVERGFLKPLGVKAYRCEKCDERFFRFGTAHSGKQEAGKTLKSGAAGK